MMIRIAHEADCDAIGKLWGQLVAYHRQLDDAMPASAIDGEMRYASRIRNHLGDSYAQTLVAEVEGEVVGFITGMILDLMPEMFEEDVAGMVGDIFVLEAFRNQGVGKALLDALRDWFRLRGASYYEWHVAVKNVTAMRFWEANGGRGTMLRMRATL